MAILSLWQYVMLSSFSFDNEQIECPRKILVLFTSNLVLFSSFFQVLLPSDKPSLVCSRCFQLFSPPSPSSSAPRKDSLSSQYHLDLSELHDMSLLNDTNNPSLSLYNTSISSSFDSLSQRSSDGLGLVCGRQPLIFDLSSCSIIHAKQEYPVSTQFNYDFQ